MTSGRSANQAMRRKPSASHWVKKLPPETYSPIRVELAAGLQRLTISTAALGGRPRKVRVASSRT
ncbi:Uncharacterised protein [Bordetella pertussis]|nr:Uncharacterised protein [Bordetella pertussis]CFW13610.1 Uncharacterised protein [Bordetella pertussis]